MWPYYSIEFVWALAGLRFSRSLYMIMECCGYFLLAPAYLPRDRMCSVGQRLAVLDRELCDQLSFLQRFLFAGFPN